MLTALNIFFCNLPSFNKHCSNEKPFRASLSMFSFATSAITLANTIANVLLNQMVVRRHNMARATVLGCLPLSRCILKKQKIRVKRRFLVTPGRTDLWWQNMIQNRCLEEDWRMSKNEFMKLVDELRIVLE